ncbi:MAG: hypothetical protein AAF667_15835 [Pseudomonadota bacterium]
MIFVVTQATVSNSAALEVVRIPKRMIGRGFGPVPKGWPRSRIFWRKVLEIEFLRIMLALSPFLLILLVRPDWSLGVSQAPLLMIGVVYWFETHVLAIPNKEKRRALIPEAEADAALDMLQQNARKILTVLAAGRQMAAGQIHLVVEQSELARVPPLTVVSVQCAGKPNRMMDLTDTEIALIEETLFSEELPEALLHRVTLSSQKPTRDFPLDMSTISAHARLAAMAV